MPTSNTVPLTYPAKKGRDATIEHAIQENALCLQSLKHGFFNDEGRLRRLSLCRGDGQFLQLGGNKVGEGFGLNVMNLVAGSQYSLGLLFEILINLDEGQKQNGVVKAIQVSSLPDCLSEIEKYLNVTPKADWVDSITF